MTSQESGATGATGGEFFAALSAAANRVAREQIGTVRAELTRKSREASGGAALLGAAGVTGAMAAGAAVITMVRMAEAVLPRRSAALLTTVALAGVSGGLAAAGVAQIRAAMPLLPEQAMGEMTQELDSAAPQS